MCIAERMPEFIYVARKGGRGGGRGDVAVRRSRQGPIQGVDGSECEG